jgi:hypothetical protein
MSIAPRYKHDDCTACHYLGQFDKYDLYFCGGEMGTTVIARWSDYGPDYSSGIVFGIMRDEVRPGVGHPLREALIRALMVPEYRNEINEHVIRYESEFPERIAAYRELLKIVDARMKEGA